MVLVDAPSFWAAFMLSAIFVACSKRHKKVVCVALLKSSKRACWLSGVGQFPFRVKSNRLVHAAAHIVVWDTTNSWEQS